MPHGLQKERTKRAPSPPGTRLADIDPCSLVGRRVGIYWKSEGRYFFGQVKSVLLDLPRHLIKYDDGTEELIDLNAQMWVLLETAPTGGAGANALLEAAAAAHELESTKEREAEVQGTDGGETFKGNVPGAVVVVGGPACMYGEQRSKASTEEEAVAVGQHYKAYRTLSGTPGYEIYSNFEGYSFEEISVRCFSRGAVQLRAQPKGATEKPVVVEEVELPTQVDNHSAQALYTEAGQLYVRVARVPEGRN